MADAGREYAWGEGEAERWWTERGPGVVGKCAEQRRQTESSSGPGTLAVELEGRSRK